MGRKKTQRRYRRPDIRRYMLSPQSILWSYKDLYYYLIRIFVSLVFLASAGPTLRVLRAVAVVNRWKNEDAAIVCTFFLFYVMALSICWLHTVLPRGLRFKQLFRPPKSHGRSHYTQMKHNKLCALVYNDPLQSYYLWSTPPRAYTGPSRSDDIFSNYLNLSRVYPDVDQDALGRDIDDAFWSHPTSNHTNVIHEIYATYYDYHHPSISDSHHPALVLIPRPRSPPLPLLIGGGPTPANDSISINRLSYPPEVIDISDMVSEPEMETADDGFSPEDWIGRGLVWGDHLPDAVQRACRLAFRVPTEMNIMFVPSPSTSVSAILARAVFDTRPNVRTDALPAPTYSVLPPDALDITTHSVDEHLEFILAALPYRRLLHDTFHNAWLSGSQSISILGRLYPLWVVRLLEDLDIFVEKRWAWMRCGIWLDQLEANDHLSAEALEIIHECRLSWSHVPYNSVVPSLTDGLTLQTRDLTTLLGTEWLNDELIDAGSQHVRSCLAPSSRIEIASCLLPLTIANVRAADAHGLSRSVHPGLESRIADGSLEQLWIPMNVRHSHWTLLLVNFTTRTLEYGDSLSRHASIPHDVKANVLWWLNELLPNHIPTSSFEERPPSFHVPEQRDSHSCGVVVLSTLSATLLQLPPWTQANHAVMRMELYLNLIKPFTDYGHDDEQLYHVEGPDTPSASVSIIDAPSFAGGHDGERSEAWTDISAASMPTLCSVSDASVEESLADMSEGSSSHGFESIHGADSYPPSSDGDDLISNAGTDSSSHFSWPSSNIVRHTSPVANHKRKHTAVTPDLSDEDAHSQASALYSKRSRHSSPHLSIGSDEDFSDSHDASSKRPQSRGTRKAGSSWDKQKALRDIASSRSSPFYVSNQKLQNFRRKILEDDPFAEFDDRNTRWVRCSACGCPVVMRLLYDVLHWRNHRKTKKCQRHQRINVRSSSLFSLGFTRDKFKPPPIASPPSASIESSPPRGPVIPHTSVTLMHASHNTQSTTLAVPAPCPGLTSQANARIQLYLSRSSAAGGGAPSRPRLANEMFNGSSYSELNVKQKNMVLQRESMLLVWRNLHNLQAVYSTECLKDVKTARDGEPLPCANCSALLSVHSFQNALNRRVPEEENMKFVPRVHRNDDLGELYLKYRGLRTLVEVDDGRSPWLKFAQGAVSGEFDSQGVALGMVEALVKRSERARRGKSLKNMSYDGAFNDFCNILASTSPRAYSTFRHHFGGRGLRNIREHRSKLPRFAPGISAVNIELAKSVLESYGYSGPIGLAWDDTAMEAALQAYKESGDAWLVVGGTGDVVRVSSHDALEEVFKEAKLKPGKLLRVYCIVVPLLKVPQIPIAALCRAGTDRSQALKSMHFEITGLLHEAGLHPVSLASDGSEIERATQRLIVQSATAEWTYTISSTEKNCVIPLRIPLFHGYPAVIVQDSKHAMKTARNQLLSGARLLVLGDYPMHFAQLRNIAMNPRSPLQTRDVINVDKQHDGAAARLLSGETLEFLIDEFPTYRGLATYIFVLGDMIDAWQNRSLPHIERVRMVLRARFFLMAWRTHILRHPDHDVNVHFISRGSYDIFLTICDSLLSLILVYRKFYSTYPLLPWLHSTEPCEHLFGVLRQLKADFTYADFLYLYPKLTVLLMGAFNHLTAEQKAQHTSAGYYHTYFKADDINLTTLMEFPDDEQIYAASRLAIEDVEQLLKGVGIDARDMLAQYRPPPSYLPEPIPFNAPSSIPGPRAPSTLAELLFLYKGAPVSSRDEKAMEVCEFAIAAEAVDSTAAILSLPDSSELDLFQVSSEIEEVLSDTVSTFSSYAPEGSLVLLDDHHVLRKNVAVVLRKRHQPKFTAQAVRKLGRLSTILAVGNESVTGLSQEPTLREALVKKLSAYLPKESSTSVSGVERRVRHTGTFTRDSIGDTVVRNRNKTTLREVKAMELIRHRESAFARLKLVNDYLHTAQVSELNILSPGHLVICAHPTQLSIVVGEVITMYSKSSARAANHDWVANVNNIGVASYINIRTFSPVYPGARMLSSVSCPSLRCATFLRVPPSHVILSLGAYTPNLVRQEVVGITPVTLVTLCQTSGALLDSVQMRQMEFQSAVQEVVSLVRKAKKKEASTADDSEGDDTEL